MSTTPQPTPDAKPARKPPSAASKYLFMFLLGLVIGIVALVMLMRTLESRKTWRDHYPHALMHLLSAQAAQLQDNAGANRCSPTDTLPHLQSLRSLGNDFERAFPELRDDRNFVAHSAKFRGTLDAALAAPPLGCEGVEQAVSQVGEACKACHQDFR
ncbi:hypothetical protein FQY83_00175 [Luteimonas marina]|uniref:Cytochrome c n=1 Tax=Luteimonas marina TaxID=488485 RepID=A0A5C5UAW9_9GAMM|nr:cytochrome c [Luteimonas marina]TWT23108.1 hypothetical protein FQY83_00175 [Luteimonas marina]